MDARSLTQSKEERTIDPIPLRMGGIQDDRTRSSRPIRILPLGAVPVRLGLDVRTVGIVHALPSGRVYLFFLV
jgi:hypothetical protein